MNVTILCYSPTGGGKQLAQKVNITNAKIKLIDITNKEARADISRINNTLKDTDILFLFVPVYSENIPNNIKSLLQNLEYSNYLCPCVTYGSICSGRVINDLIKCFKNPRVIGAAEFVCIHSYDLGRLTTRPNEEDFIKLKHLCELVNTRLMNNTIISDYFKTKKHLMSFFTRRFERNNVRLPICDKDKCNLCGLCTSSCPLGIIDNMANIIAKKSCTRCYACVKVCMTNARNQKISRFASFYLRKKIDYSKDSIIY